MKLRSLWGGDSVSRYPFSAYFLLPENTLPYNQRPNLKNIIEVHVSSLQPNAVIYFRHYSSSSDPEERSLG